MISENQMPLDSAVVNVGCTGAVLQVLFGVRIVADAAAEGSVL